MKNRVWVYLSDKPFTADVETALASDVTSFLEDWNAHGTALSSSFAILHHHFIIIQADEEKFSASGCSIDKQLRFIKDAEQKYGLSLLNRLVVAYRSGNEIKTVHSSKIPAMLSAGEISENTIVYNVGVGNDTELGNNFEVPLKQSWLAKFLSPVK
jgi:hypothetical protein